MSPRPAKRFLSRALKFSSNVAKNLKKDPSIVGYMAGSVGLMEGTVSFISYMGGERQPNALTWYATASSALLIGRMIYLLGRNDDDDGRRKAVPRPQPRPSGGEKPDFYKLLKLDEVVPRTSRKVAKTPELV